MTLFYFGIPCLSCLLQFEYLFSKIGTFSPEIKSRHKELCIPPTRKSDVFSVFAWTRHNLHHMFTIAVCNHFSNICISNKFSVHRILFLQGVETVEAQHYHQPASRAPENWVRLVKDPVKN